MYFPHKISIPNSNNLLTSYIFKLLINHHAQYYSNNVFVFRRILVRDLIQKKKECRPERIHQRVYQLSADIILIFILSALKPLLAVSFTYKMLAKLPSTITVRVRVSRVSLYSTGSEITNLSDYLKGSLASGQSSNFPCLPWHSSSASAIKEYMKIG